MPTENPLKTMTLKEQLMRLTARKKTESPHTVHDKQYVEQHGSLLALSNALNVAHQKYNDPSYKGSKDDFSNTHLGYYHAVKITPSLRGNENVQLLGITRKYQASWEKLAEIREDSPAWDEAARDVHGAFITLKVAYEVLGSPAAKKSLAVMEPPPLPESAHLGAESKPSNKMG